MIQSIDNKSDVKPKVCRKNWYALLLRIKRSKHTSVCKKSQEGPRHYLVTLKNKALQEEEEYQAHRSVRSIIVNIEFTGVDRQIKASIKKIKPTEDQVHWTLTTLNRPIAWHAVDNKEEENNFWWNRSWWYDQQQINWYFKEPQEEVNQAIRTSQTNYKKNKQRR